MQFRHLRYFVSIVDAGSFSRAAATIHVAQPALSQQIAELEEMLGVSLLQRSARGVRPTPAGQAFYTEAMAVLRHMERIPGIVRSAGGEPEGIVTVGMSSTLAASLAGPLMEACGRALPRVALRFVTADSLDLRSRIDSHTLELAIVFEDEAVPGYVRTPLYRQRLFLVRRDRKPRSAAVVSLQQMAEIPLVLPSAPNLVRALLDREFARAGLRPNIVVETDVFSGMVSAIVAGVGSGVLPRGDFSDLPASVKLWAQCIEPALYVTATIVSSPDAPLTRAGEEVRSVLRQFIVERQLLASTPGAESLAEQP